MYTDVYVDVLFLINFTMDAIALYITSRLCSQRPGILRTVVAASVGALYSILSVFVVLEPLLDIFVFVLICLIMSCIAWKCTLLSDIIKRSVIMLISSSLLGGIMSAAYSMLSKISFLSYGDTYSLRGGLLGFFILASLSLFGAMILTSLHGSGNMPSVAYVKIILFGKEVNAKGIFDSGNLLRDPLSGRYVIIVRSDLFSGVLSSDFLKSAEQADVSLLERISNKEKVRFRLVPMKGVGEEKILIGVSADKVKLKINKKGKEVYVDRDAVIGLISALDKDIECIVPQVLI